MSYEMVRNKSIGPNQSNKHRPFFYDKTKKNDKIKIEKPKKNAKRILSAVNAFKKKPPAFDPLPFLGDIQQKEHNLYKNLRY